MSYHSWDRKTIIEYTDDKVSEMYANGFVFTRLDKDVMNQTRSIRINLKEFELNSENRRILRKTEGIKSNPLILPLSDDLYDWKIHKLGKDFYTQKFGPKTFSAQKVKELITTEKSNFNLLFRYTVEDKILGYAICYQNKDVFHYAFPFYDLNEYHNNYGMAMMLQAILYAQKSANDYIYLGSVTRPGDKYKLQFKGLEWFDGKEWKSDLDELKEILVEE